MTVREIVELYLEANGYDGLCGDECGCLKGDLAPCVGCGDMIDCVPGYKTECDPANCPADGDCDFHISERKKAKKIKIT
jgi:hypothetical protein